MTLGVDSPSRFGPIGIPPWRCEAVVERPDQRLSGCRLRKLHCSCSLRADERRQQANLHSVQHRHRVLVSIVGLDLILTARAIVRTTIVAADSDEHGGGFGYVPYLLLDVLPESRVQINRDGPVRSFDLEKGL